MKPFMSQKINTGFMGEDAKFFRLFVSQTLGNRTDENHDRARFYKSPCAHPWNFPLLHPVLESCNFLLIMDLSKIVQFFWR